LKNRKHPTKAWKRQIEACRYWGKRDHCRWNGRLNKPLFNMPDTHKDGSNIVQHRTDHLSRFWFEMSFIFQ